MSDYRITLKIDMSGLERKSDALDRLSRVIRDCAWRATGYARLSLTGIKSGRAYLVSNRPGSPPRIHIASAPGEAPATLTGALRNSIKPREGTSKWESRVGVEKEYGQILERKKNRPFLIPAGQEAFKFLVAAARSIADGS
jgi:hypothetical protein